MEIFLALFAGAVALILLVLVIEGLVAYLIAKAIARTLKDLDKE
tara:strand:+ start:9860 stop:9991 length:132 start_codon:yes stop_codon:yes gene_type:complete